jgi:hypothetical protein
MRTQKIPMIIKMIESDATAVMTEKEKSRGFFLGMIANECTPQDIIEQHYGNNKGSDFIIHI